MTDLAEHESHVTPVNVRVGLRIRLRRTLLGMSQQQLGKALGITFQQVQNYERGVERVATSRLYDLARMFGVAVGFFYDDLESTAGTGLSAAGFAQHGFADVQYGFADDASSRLEVQELLRAYNRIADPALRRQALDMLKSLAPAE